jgi:hypothetical protein
MQLYTNIFLGLATSERHQKYPFILPPLFWALYRGVESFLPASKPEVV